MNLEIANRLQKLRKEKGYSQEQLADALGLSRQAVSKWERAEASPDTDNLVCLAKLYGISLDELLRTDETIEDIKKDQELKNETFQAKKGDDTIINISGEGIHITDDEGNTVNISGKGLTVQDKDKKVIKIRKDKKSAVHKMVSDMVVSTYVLASIIIFLTFGFMKGLWHPLWILFLGIPVVDSIIECFFKRKITAFCYPIAITIAYLLIGFLYNGWHPYWVLFLTIPVFYVFFEPLDKLIHRNDHQNDITNSIDNNK